MIMDYIPFKNPLGRPLKYTPAQLAEEFEKYVKWCHNNPLYAQSRTDYEKGFASTEETKPRRISIDGFQVWLGCSDCWWSQLSNGKRGKEFSRVKEGIKKYCESYQIDMASAGLLNGNIISRILGLADKQVKDVNVKEGFTLVIGEDTAQELNK